MAKNKVRTAINNLCDRIQQANFDMGECKMFFTWKGSDLYIQRIDEHESGCLLTEIYHLDIEAILGLLSIDFDIDDDGEVDELFWDEVQHHRFISFQ